MMFSHSTASGYEYKQGTFVSKLSPAAGGHEEWPDDGMGDRQTWACHHMLIMLMVMTEL